MNITEAMHMHLTPGRLYLMSVRPEIREDGDFSLYSNNFNLVDDAVEIQEFIEVERKVHLKQIEEMYQTGLPNCPEGYHLERLDNGQMCPIKDGYHAVND